MTAVPSALPKRIDVTKALKLRIKGNTFAEIAAVLGCTAQGVEQALDKFKTFLKDLTEPGQLEAYQSERANLLTAVEAKLLRSIVDEEAIQKAPLHSRVIAYGTIFDKRRLEAGQSTENLGILGKIILDAEGELSKPAKEKKTE